VKNLHFSLALVLCIGCATEPVPVDPPEPALRRLTQDQYRNLIADLLGADVVVPPALEPDLTVDGFVAVGSALSSISARGVEQYEEAAYSVAEQALGPDAAGRDALVPCTPSGAVDDACAEAFLGDLAYLAWRRPVTEAELARLVAVAGQAGQALGDWYAGAQFGVAAILQSPNFLFREQIGEDDPDNPGGRRFSSWEMASRLSFLLWNTGPDRALLDAAEAGDLVTEEGLVAEVERMMADDKARGGIRAFFSELYKLYLLDDLEKDPAVYVHMADDVGPAAREETLQNVETLVFDEDADFREFITGERTFINPKLASIYNVRAPARDGFAEATFTEADGRRGFLGQLSFLALNSHPVRSSATLRGKFVRETLLCQSIPEPPADVDTSIPEPSGDAPTLRDRVADHLSVDACAGCHEIMDPIGLGFENFDGIGRWRTTQGGATIDPSGDLDGEAFNDAWGLADRIANHERFGSCLARSFFRYGVGHLEEPGEIPALAALGRAFEDSGFRVQDLVLELVLSPAFRETGELTPRTPRLFLGDDQ
jgi:hypothetical protein